MVHLWMRGDWSLYSGNTSAPSDSTWNIHFHIILFQKGRRQYKRCLYLTSFFSTSCKATCPAQQWCITKPLPDAKFSNNFIVFRMHATWTRFAWRHLESGPWDSYHMLLQKDKIWGNGNKKWIILLNLHKTYADYVIILTKIMVKYT
jgi:hypothetical protein